MKSKVNPYDCDEIYHLPIVVTERDIQMERIYNEFYNDEYWEEYKKKKHKGVDYSK